MHHFLESDRYKNQFETNTSGGALNHEARKVWENNLFNYKYLNTEPKNRVKYGTLKLVNDPKGMGPCTWYGNSYFELKNVKLRSTFLYGDSSNK